MRLNENGCLSDKNSPTKKEKYSSEFSAKHEPSVFGVLDVFSVRNLQVQIILAEGGFDGFHSMRRSLGVATVFHGVYPTGECFRVFVDYDGWVLHNQYSLVGHHARIPKIAI
jgi:hypothetical protein